MPKGVYLHHPFQSAATWFKKGSKIGEATRFVKVHGHAGDGIHGGSRTYRTWLAMRSRCDNPNSTQYPLYGGRGIKICEQWRSFMTFLTDMGERPIGTTIDRIDSNGNYEPSNCRWATPKEQRNNQRRCYAA